VSTGSLHDRLQRLRRPAEAGLEDSILGPPSAEPSLKARLEKLVEAAMRRDRRAAAMAPPLEELVQGMRVENERGEFFLKETDVHLEVRHGDVPLSRFRTLDLGTVGILTAEAALARFDLSQAAFLDTETTGLAGGAGTAAFLVGVGFVEGERFRVRQYFMRDYHEEAALLHALAEDLGRFRHLVTFNGKMFDVPLLDARYRLNRVGFPLAEVPHFDLLHPARRLWRARLESCRLQALEGELLGLVRVGDVPGEQIPQIYFDYVRRRDARAMARVFEHNRQDIVSLAALAVLACQWVEEGRAEDPRDVYSLARVLERARLYERSDAEYRRTLGLEPGPLRVAALMRLAARARRNGDHAAAAALWEEAAESGEILALRALAVHHEHRRRDPDAALETVDRALRGLAGARSDDPRARRFARDFAKRRSRLIDKRERAAPATSPRCAGTPRAPE
jgi:uncharacterized protein YprB with RNaseH-like and TPR domain